MPKRSQLQTYNVLHSGLDAERVYGFKLRSLDQWYDLLQKPMSKAVQNFHKYQLACEDRAGKHFKHFIIRRTFKPLQGS